jgi:orotate phosphoribosyltransferase
MQASRYHEVTLVGPEFMHLLPTQDDVVRVLRDTGALRDGHFEYPNGLHSNEYLQVPLAMRYYQHARTLSVGLSRKLRANSEIRAMIPQLSIVAPATGGLPVAYGVCEALRAHQVYWAERQDHGLPLRFRQFLEQTPGESVVLVDDILRSGANLSEMRTLLESRGATVMALAVVIYQPTPKTPDFGSLPLYYLAKLDASYYTDAASCDLCKQGVPLEKVWV